jgi:flavin-binding protein dodecin
MELRKPLDLKGQTSLTCPHQGLQTEAFHREHSMTVAKVIELTSASSKSIEDAVESGIKRADQTLDQIESAWVQDIKCVVKNGKVVEWRVNMKLTFLLK